MAAFAWRAALFLAVASLAGPSRAFDVTGELQVGYASSRNTALQRSLVQTSLYVESELVEDTNGYLSFYHDRDFRSVTLGVAKRVGHVEFALGLGQAVNGGRRHFMVNPWLLISNDEWEAYLHAERYAAERDEPWWFKAYGIWRFDRLGAGVYYDRTIGFGPRFDVRIGESISAWLIAAAMRPREGNVRAVFGVTIDF